VTFHLNNGQPDFPETVEEGKFANGPTPTPSKTGFTFEAWYTDNGTWGHKWDLATHPVTANVDLYAKWNPITYTITFNANGGFPTPPSQSKHYGDKVTEPSGVTWPGHTLEGWYSDEQLTPASKWDFDNSTVTESITLYAKWTVDTYTVTFDAKGGSPTPDPQSKHYGDKVTEPSGVTKAGHSLEGWYADEAYTPAKKWDFDNSTVTESITLYAKWIALHTVTFHLNNGQPD